MYQPKYKWEKTFLISIPVKKILTIEILWTMAFRSQSYCKHRTERLALPERVLVSFLICQCEKQIVNVKRALLAALSVDRESFRSWIVACSYFCCWWITWNYLFSRACTFTKVRLLWFSMGDSTFCRCCCIFNINFQFNLFCSPCAQYRQWNIKTSNDFVVWVLLAECSLFSTPFPADGTASNR